MKKFFLFFLSILFALVFCDIVVNLSKIRPLLWKNSRYSYLNVGWYTWDGADHRYTNEIHKKQTNGFLTRGKKPNPALKHNLILLGDSNIETALKINEMPENYLRNYLNDTNVISFGSWGWGTDQQYLHLKKYIGKIKPNHIVLWFSLNDLKENALKYGFLGAKPTFVLKKNKNKKNYYLSGPNTLAGKNYFEYSYFYRATNKLLEKLKLIKSKSYFEYLKSCEDNNFDNYISRDQLLDNYYDIKNYVRTKKIAIHFEKPYGRKPANINNYPSFEKWKKEMYSNFLKDNKKKSLMYSEKKLYDPLYINRIVLSDTEREREILTNKILLKIQDLANKHQASFHILFPYEPPYVYQTFDTEEIYRYCFNDREFLYSNKAFKEKLGRIFKGIESLLIVDFNDFYLESYDFFDGHFSSESNNYIMKKLSTYINMQTK